MERRDPSAVQEPKTPEPGQAASRRMLAGRLIDHGAAPYRHDPHEPRSYFVKLETARGERALWGVDLQRAFRQSLTKPEVGDEIGLTSFGCESVTVKAVERSDEGQVLGSHELATHRNRWIVEKLECFRERAEAADAVRNPALKPRESVGRHPEFAGTYLTLRGAEEVARRRIRDSEDQRRFVDTVRAALADSVARGEPLAAVRLRERASRRPARAAEREAAATRG